MFGMHIKDCYMLMILLHVIVVPKYCVNVLKYYIQCILNCSSILFFNIILN